MIRSACSAWVVGAILAGAHLGVLRAHARTWTDSTGKHKVEAEFIEVADGKVRLKKTDGTEVSLPLTRLSEADQEFAKSQSGLGPQSGSDGAEDEPYKEGDKVYLQVRGQWQLGEITEIKDGPGSARFVVNLKTGDRRQLRATEKRLRRYGKAGEGDVLLPGDVVEVKQGFDWVPGEVISHDGRWAKVRVEGSVGESSKPLTSLRVPGSVSSEANVGSTSAARDKPKPVEKSPAIVFPDEPELTPTSLVGVKIIDIPRTGTAESIDLGSPLLPLPAGSLRSLPIALLPKRDVFDKVLDYSVAEDGSRAVVVRGNVHSNAEQIVELIDLKGEGKPLLLPMPPETKKARLSPDGKRLLSLRHDFYQAKVKADLWKIEDAGLSHVISWQPKTDEDHWEKFKDARWLDDQTVLTTTSKATIAWQADSAKPLYQIESDNVEVFGPRGKFLLFSQGKLGIAAVDSASGDVRAVIGRKEALQADLSVSPSGKMALLSKNSGLLELWDLPSGKKLIRTLCPQGIKGIGVFTESEHLARFNWNAESKLCDLRTLQEVEAPGEPSGRPFRGYLWSAVGSSSEPFKFAAVPKQTKQVSGSTTPSLDGPFAFKPGDSVALDIQVDGSIASEVRQLFVKGIEAHGGKVDDSSRVKIVARTEFGESESKTYKSFFAERGQEQEQTVSFQRRNYLSQLLVDGEVRIEHAWSAGLPMSVHPEKGESIQQHINKQIKWEARYVPWVELPDYIFDASK